MKNRNLNPAVRQSLPRVIVADELDGGLKVSPATGMVPGPLHPVYSAMKRKLDLTNDVDRRELLARARSWFDSLTESSANELRWLVSACEELPDHQDNWKSLHAFIGRTPGGRRIRVGASNI